MKIVGLFPEFDHHYGGVQTSAKLAWTGLVNYVGSDALHLVSYDGQGKKLSASLSAAGAPKRPSCVLVWHLGLLKLLPLVDPSLTRGVVFLHGIEAWRRLDRLTAMLLRRCRRVLTNSDYTWSRFVELNPGLADLRHTTVPLGIAEPEPELAVEPLRRSAVIVGRLEATEQYKGHAELIAAWPSVVARVPDAELIVIGSGGLLSHLQELVRQSPVARYIRFVGRLDEAEKEQAIRESRCLAMPSRGEGFGLVYLEAMRLGRPCLVSTADAGREVVNPPEAGLAVDPHQEDDLVEALSRLLGNGTEWQEWSRRARDRFNAKFTREHFQRRLLNALGEAIERDLTRVAINS